MRRQSVCSSSARADGARTPARFWDRRLQPPSRARIAPGRPGGQPTRGPTWRSALHAAAPPFACRRRSGARLLLAVLLTLLFLPLPSGAAAGPIAEAHLAWAAGHEALARGEAAAALEHLDAALALDPDLARAQHERGVALAHLGRLDAAVDALEQAARLLPDDARVHLDLALAYLAAGDDFWAADEVALAAELAPDDTTVAFWEAVCLLRVRDDRAAAAALSRAGGQLDDDASAFLNGLVALRLGSVEAARSQLDEVATREPPSAWVEAAAEGASALSRAGWDVPPLWSAALRLGGEYDSNVLLEPDGAGESLSAASAGASVRGLLTVSPVATAGDLLSATLGAGRISYLAEEPSQLSTTTASARLGYRHRLAHGGSSHALGVSLGYDLVLLDGGPLTDEPDLHAWSETVGGHVRYELDDGGLHRAFADLGVLRAWLSDLRRTGESLRAEVGDTLRLSGGRLKLLVAASGRYDLATGRGFDLWGAGGRVGLSALAPWSLEVAAQVAYEHRAHFDSADYAGWGPDGRDDDVLTALVEVRRPLWGPLSVELSWTHVEHGSTARVYSYRRDLAALALLVRWP